MLGDIQHHHRLEPEVLRLQEILDAHQESKR